MSEHISEPLQGSMNLEKIEAGVRMILEGIGEDPDREGLQKTPSRVARMYEEVFAGLYEDPAVHFETTFDEHHEELVIVHDIPFYSCSFGGCVCSSPSGTRASYFPGSRHLDGTA